MHLLRALQILQAIIVPVLTDSPEQYNLFPKKSCCSDMLPTTRGPSWHPRLWQKTLREAAYQSIMRHTEFTGTLDDRLNRDHQLWSKIKDAIFKEKSINSGSETTGVLVDRQRRNGLEFQQSDKYVYECPGERCKTNESLVALWRVRKTQDPNGHWIRVKLPTDQGTPIEDVYEYNVKYGLKRLKNNAVTNSSHDKTIQDRIDVRFPDDSVEMFNTPKIKKPHPAVIVETGRHFVQQPVTNIGAIVADGYRHVIHGIGPIALPQEQEFQQRRYNGFLPSIGPIQPPSIPKPIVVYDTPNQYNPSFINVFGKTLNNYYKPREQTTQKPTNFKPSKEYVQFSEVDPFFHHEQITPPIRPHIPFTINFPDSINAQLPPTVSNIELPQTTTPDPKPQFQIIVGDYPTKLPQSTLLQETTIDLFTPSMNLITPSLHENNITETESSLQQSTVKDEQTTELTTVTELNELLTTLNESILYNMVDFNVNKEYTTIDDISNSTEQTEPTEANDFYTNNLFSENVLNSTLEIIKIMNETTTEHLSTFTTELFPTTLPEYTKNENTLSNVSAMSETTTYRIPSIFDDVSTNKTAKETDFDSIFTSLSNKLFPITEDRNSTIKPTRNADREAQESLKDFRLLTYPGDPISIVEHRISKSVSYKTAKGKTGIVPVKEDAARKKLTQLIFKNNNALAGRGNSVVGRTELNSILSHLVKTSRQNR